MKKLLAYLPLTALLLSCSAKEESKQETTYTDTITIGVTPTLDCLPFFIAKESGIADSMGIDLRIRKYGSRADCDTALVRDRVSAIATDYVRAEKIKENWNTLLAQFASAKAKPAKSKGGRQNAANSSTQNITPKKTANGNIPHDTLTLFPHQNLQLYLFANSKSRIREARQLTDKMIAGDRYGADGSFATHVLDSLKLSEKTFIVQMQNISTRTMMIENNIMDAAVVTEPQASYMRKTGHKVLYSSDMLKSKPIGCIIARKNQDIIRKMYNRACDSIKKNGLHHYDSLIVKHQAIPQKIVKAISNHKFVKL